MTHTPFVISRDAAAAMVREPSAIPTYPAIKAAFNAEGYLNDVPHDYKLRRLRKIMGPERHRQTQVIQAERDRLMAEGRFNEAPSEDSLYRLLETRDEAHCFYSIQSQTSIVANAAAYDAIVRDLPAGSRVADLGCYTGSMARFIASTHPSFTVHGFDRLHNLIAIAEGHDSGANAEFGLWDYSIETDAPPVQVNALLSVLGLPLGELLSVDDLGAMPEDPREASIYRRALPIIATASKNWAKIAAPGATLCVVARAGAPPLMVALVDAYLTGGWQLRKEATTLLKAEGEVLPLLVFDYCETVDMDCALTPLEATHLWIAGLLS